MADDQAAQPLAGLRVLDAGSFIAAPLAAMLLGDWGAEVIKLEPLLGDAARTVGAQVAPGMSSTFVSCNRGKRSIALNLRDREAGETVRRLAATCDVVVHNLPPASSQHLGLDHPSLLKGRDDAVLCTISAFGPDGPYAGRAALDPIVQAMAGIAAATGDPDGPPMRCAAPVIDTAAAFAAAAATLAALHSRERGGRWVSVALLDVALAFQGPLLALRSLLGTTPPRRGNGSYAVLGDQLATADGLIAFVVWDTPRWVALCDVLGLPELGDDARFATNDGRCELQDELRPLLAAAFRDRPGAELEASMLAAGVPCAITQDLDGVVADEHVIASEAVYPERRLGRPLTMASGPARIDGCRPRAAAPPPALGQHTEAILAGLTGSDDGRTMVHADEDRQGLRS